MAHDHLFGGLALGRAGRLRHRRRDNEPAAVLHQRVAHEAELGFLAPSLAKKLRLGIGGRGMRAIAALLTVKIPFAVWAGTGRIVRAVLRLEALHRSPSRNLGAVHRE